MNGSLLNDSKNMKVIEDNLGWVELERRPSMAQVMGNPSCDGELFIPGSGVAKQLYEKWQVLF